MNISFTVNMTKAELDAMKENGKVMAKHFGKAFNGSELNKKYNQKIRMKMSAANLLAYMRLKDTYEIVCDLEVDESYLVEYMALVNRAMPLIGGLLNVMGEINVLANSKFKVIETDIIDLDAA